jgi:C1A family cysteine protease
MEKRHLKGWKKDKRDPRDFLFKMLPTIPQEKLPASIDLRNKMSSVEQQGGVGSCTANAAVGALEYLKHDKLESRFLWFKRFKDLSRLFVYWNTRDLDGSVDADGGASIRDTIKALAKFGTCYEKTWPYSETKWAAKPSERCYKEAEQFKSKVYYRAETRLEVLNALAQRFPVEFGAVLYESFEAAGIGGTVPMPLSSERQIGGHAMLIVGYSIPSEHFIVRNSWGPTWGDRGYCYLPFTYCRFGDLVDDFWVIKE